MRPLALLAVVALAKGCGDESPSAPPAAPDPASPARVAVSPATAELDALGATVQLSAGVRDQHGNVMAGAAVAWSSGAAAVATVSVSGLVTAVRNGTAAITATAGSVSGSATVTVAQRVSAVAVSPPVATLVQGDTLRLSAEAADANGHAVPTAEFVWASSDTLVAVVDDGGLVTGVGSGEVEVTAVADGLTGSAVLAVVENPDRAALVALYEATDGPNWTKSDHWLTDAPLGNWYGVETDDSRVVALHLGGNGLAGSIPPDIGALAYLEGLTLFDNGLTGPIPAEIGNLAHLRSLALSGNRLTGPIPSEVGSLVELTDLSLQNNRLTGSIPPEIGNLANLTRLVLQNNRLTGPIPPEIGNLANLSRLFLDNNELTDPIPRSLLRLDGLQTFQFAHNSGLCARGTAEFAAWLQRIDHDDHETCNAVDVAALRSLFEATGGTDWTDSAGWLGEGAVEEWHGVSADSLGHVTELDLSRNGLAGELPQDLADLAQMTVLRIAGNALSGRLPLALAQVPLREFRYAATELCAPAQESFRAWLNGIADHQGTGVECVPISDREILEILWDATDGPNWIDSEDWLTDRPLGTWWGVDVNDEGRVVRLTLGNNNLRGRIPAELGGLTRLTHLEMYSNRLTGPLPPELGDLSDLTLLDISANGLTGAIPAQLGELANLTTLTLSFNSLTGPIPSELGDLSDLILLELAFNSLTGPIPPQLGNLAHAEILSLWGNDLTAIPSEIGNLANLRKLSLHHNSLAGPIPSEIGNLRDLATLTLHGNNLTGLIPPEIGDLTGLDHLRLGANRLSGPIPAELGALQQLRELDLSSNLLMGSIPPALGGLASLVELYLGANAELSGPLPASLTSLRSLETLETGGTMLCAPTDAAFLGWLETIRKWRVASCASPPMAYLVQVVQSREFPVPLVAGEDALLRVFPTAIRANGAPIPPVRASFFLAGALAHAADIPGKLGPVPTEVDERSLSRSANSEIPGEIVRPGLEMVVEIDPDGTLDPALGVARRIPEAGRLAVDVRTMPVLDLTVIPFLWSQAPDSAVVEAARGMEGDPEGHDLLWPTRTLLPVTDLQVAAHEPVLSSTNHASDLLDQTSAIRVMEGGDGHYLGMMAGATTGPSGIANTPGRVAFSKPNAGTIAHELGHNMSLLHAPCGTSGDRFYPYRDGSIGAQGYDFRDGGLVPDWHFDLMSYCGPWWISDYSFDKALRFRWVDEGAPGTPAPGTPPVQSLLLWGGVDAEGQPYLEPAFVIDAPPSRAHSDGEYEVVGHARDGSTLLSLRFEMPETSDGEGRHSFAFALPADPEWAGTLASITLSGPGGEALLDADTERPMVILRDPSTGRVRGFLRDPPPPAQAAAHAVGRRVGGLQLDVFFSRGIPDAAAWRR